MNATIYRYTILKIVQHKFVLFVLIAMSLGGPFMTRNGLSTSHFLPEFSPIDPLTISILMGLLIVTATNCIGSTFTLGGKSDYMPLIMTRPIPRWHYVVSKWLALATVMSVVLAIQNVVLLIACSYSSLYMTPQMLVAGFVDGTLTATAAAAVITLVYMLPTQTSTLIGLVALEVALAFQVLSISLPVPQTATSAGIIDIQIDILGTGQWMRNEVLPTILGGNAADGFSGYSRTLQACVDFLAPRLYLHDVITARPVYWTPILGFASNTLIALTCAILLINSREFHYDVE